LPREVYKDICLRRFVHGAKDSWVLDELQRITKAAPPGCYSCPLMGITPAAISNLRNSIHTAVCRQALPGFAWHSPQLFVGIFNRFAGCSIQSWPNPSFNPTLPQNGLNRIFYPPDHLLELACEWALKWRHEWFWLW
jgi:hypothetical protein